MLKPVVPGDEKGREGRRRGGWTYWGHGRGGGSFAGSPSGVRAFPGWWRLAS